MMRAWSAARDRGMVKAASEDGVVFLKTAVKGRKHSAHGEWEGKTQGARDIGGTTLAEKPVSGANCTKRRLEFVNY